MRSIAIICCILLFGLTLVKRLGNANSPSSSKKRRVLFICTGNYYRSRLAEALFNFSSAKNKLDWEAISRGTDINSLSPLQRESNVSELVKIALIDLKIPLSFLEGSPTQLSQDDLALSNYVIALNRQEHQSVLDKRYPLYNSKIHYWDIGDSNILNPAHAIKLITQKVETLVKSLGN